jgi:hypothetical protein
VAPRISLRNRFHARPEALSSSDREPATVREEVGRLTGRLLMRQAMEAEVDVFLGRRPDERHGENSPVGFRNGWQPPVTLRTISR